MKTSKPFILFSFVGVIFFFSGCTSIPRQTQLMRETEAVNISALELRDRLNNFAVRFSAIVEETADQIIAQSEDPVIDQDALLWKMNAIPASQKALFLSDPLAALIDISVFAVQMRLYFAEGSGRELFGEWHHLAIDATTQLEEELTEMWRAVKVNINIAEKEQSLVYQWARGDPIESLTFLRRSVSDTLMGLIGQDQLSFRKTIGSLAVTAYDLRERLTIYTDQLPKQARWQVEYLISKTMNNEQVEKSLDDFSQLTSSLERITDMVEQSQELVNDVWASTIAELRKERIAIVEAIREERIAALGEIDRQRVAMIEHLEAFTLEFSSKTIKESSNTVDELIDHFFWRMLQLLVIVVILGVLSFLLIRKAFKS